MTEAQSKQFLHDFDTIQNKLLFQKNYHDTYSNSISKLSCNSDEFKSTHHKYKVDKSIITLYNVIKLYKEVTFDEKTRRC